MPATDKLNVGFVTTVGGRWPRELPQERHSHYPKWLDDQFENVNVVASDKLTITPDDVNTIVKQFKGADVDVVCLVIGAFGGDINIVLLAEKLKVPIIVWALPDPPYDGGRLISNALVAATMNSAALKRFGHKCHFVYGLESDERVQSELALLTRTYYVAKCMKNTFLGLVGYRPTGFYSSTFDELLIRQTFGLRLEECDLSILFDKAKNADADAVEKDMKFLRESTNMCDLPEEHLKNHSQIYLAFKELVEEQGFDAITLKCWPEMGEFKCTPCGVMSRFADEGFFIGCEGDVDATLTMLIQHYFTGTIPFMCDLINVDEPGNTVLFWHCGQAASSLHSDSSTKEFRDHSLAGQGTVLEGTLKAGRVTVALATKIGGAYKLFFVTGEAVETDKELRGVMVRVKLDAPVIDAIYKIADEGVPHHYSIVWEDLGEELRMLAQHLGIETIEVG